jgi:phosphoserine aminotransferase
MTPENFVELWKSEKTSMLRMFTDQSGTTAEAQKIQAMQLTPDQSNKLGAVLDTVLTDAMYTLLLALDGEGSIGGVQQIYELKSEDGAVLTGALEAEAWKQFHAS